MYRAIDVLRLLPDRPGRGGAKFGYHAFQQEPINDTREVKNVFVWQDSWRSDSQGSTSILGNVYDDESQGVGMEMSVLALHGYTKFSKTDPLIGPTTEILGHNFDANFGGYVWNYSSYVDWTLAVGGGGVVLTWDKNKVCPASHEYPAVFANVNNRCFIATGTNEIYIYDSSVGPDVFGNGSGQPHTYTLGIGAPTAAPVIEAAGIVETSAAYARIGSRYLSYNDPNGALANAETQTTDTLGFQGDGLKLDGSVVGEGFDIFDKTTVFSTAGMTVSLENGSDIAYFSPPASIPPINGWVGLTLTIDGRDYIMLAFGNATPAEFPVIPVDAVKLDKIYRGPKKPYLPGGGISSDPWDHDYDIINAPFTVTGVRWEMSRGGLPATWPGGTSSQTTIVGELLDTGGALTWEETPPSYAYAWYDPVSGHISNISPVFSPEETDKTKTGIAVNVDVGQISYVTDTTKVPTPKFGTNPFPRWTHILFFRTLMAGGSTLYPIGSLNPTVPDPNDATRTLPNPEWRGLPNDQIQTIPPPGTGNYWYDSARDSELLISGALRAPQFTNGKPRVIDNGVETTLFPSHMAFWDGRLWVAAPQDPSAVHYSCDRVQCPFGVPEESFPDTNVLRIPASDGCVRGMKLIGERLLITTERWAYTIAGNNEANYRLVRISTRMGGVGNYQMDEFVSDVEGDAALVVFLGTDGRVYAMPLGGQAIWISKEIQTYLSAANLSVRSSYNLCRVHCLTRSGRRLAVVYVPTKTFLYDFDRKIWSEHTIKNTTNVLTNPGADTAWATISTATSSNLELYSLPNLRGGGSTLSEGRVWNWLDESSTLPVPAGYVRTFPLNFDGKKTRKQLRFVRIYVNDPSFTSVDPGTGITTFGWRVSVRTDSDDLSTTITPVSEYDSAYRLIVADGDPVDGQDVAELIATDAALNGSTPMYGYTFDVRVTFPQQTDRIYQLYAIDIGWATVSDGQVDP